jgi:hypothetical protein
MAKKKVKTLKKRTAPKSAKKKFSKSKILKSKAKKPARVKISSPVLKKRVEVKPEVIEAPAKPKKNYKLPNYKKKCIECLTFKFIKGGWSLCMQCYEKKYGKYLGEDRFLYVQQGMSK